MRDEDFTMEKLRIREDLSILTTEVRLTNAKMDDNLSKLNILITGNGHPETGISYRLAKIEETELKHKEEKEARRGLVTAGVSFASIIIAGVITDWVSRIMFHHH